MAELHHECGIAGIYYMPTGGNSKVLSSEFADDAAQMIPRMLLDLQNRGQLAAGMSSYNPDRNQLIDTYKEIGSVIEAFRLNHEGKFKSLMDEYTGRAGIGHVRYATCGKDDRSYAQPFERNHGCKWKWFSFVYNGQLANYADLAQELLDNEGYHLTRKTDTEVVMHHLSYLLRNQRMPLREVFAQLADKFDGSYNLIYLNAEGEMGVMRDPLGLRPLCYAVDGPVVAFASESVALLNLGFEEIQPVNPGEIITIENGVMRKSMIDAPKRSAHCFFEWIYFANVASEIDDRSVYQSRSRLGVELARSEPLVPDQDTVVVPVPDTAKAAADAMAFELRCPSMEGLIRNRYIGRTFIQGSGRGDRARLKYTPLRQVLEGKKVLLVEDTIVRSTTMRGLAKLMREKGGAKEIHVRVACPPIVAPCFYGIDMSTVSELFAPAFLNESFDLTEEAQQQMADDLEVDSLRYLPVDALARAIDLPPERLCRACVTGEYPTQKGRELYEIALGGSDTPMGGRTYDTEPATVG